MLLEKNIEFSNLNSIFILHFNNIAISSTAGFVLCGIFEQNYYLQNNVFAIPIFESHKICSAFYDVINFFSNNETSSEPKPIIEINNEVLFWKGDILHKDNNLTEKRIQLGIETQKTSFKIDILFGNFQNFVIGLEKALKSAFCFKFEDYVFLNFILKQPLNVIGSYADDFEALKCIKIFNDTHVQFCKIVKIDFLQYYLELILVLKKINMLIMDKQPRKNIFKNLI
jgi:hypothetical protein